MAVSKTVKWSFEFADGGYYLYARRGHRYARHKLPVDGDYYDIEDYRLEYIRKTLVLRLNGPGKK